MPLLGKLKLTSSSSHEIQSGKNVYKGTKYSIKMSSTSAKKVSASMFNLHNVNLPIIITSDLIIQSRCGLIAEASRYYVFYLVTNKQSVGTYFKTVQYSQSILSIHNSCKMTIFLPPLQLTAFGIPL